VNRGGGQTQYLCAYLPKTVRGGERTRTGDQIEDYYPAIVARDLDGRA
jgi:hypothetical protein